MADSVQISTLEQWYSTVAGFYQAIKNEDSSIVVPASSSGLSSGSLVTSAKIDELINNINSLLIEKSRTVSNVKVYFTYSDWSSPPKKDEVVNQLIPQTKKDNLDLNINELKQVCVNNSKRADTYNNVSVGYSNSGYGQAYDGTVNNGVTVDSVSPYNVVNTCSETPTTIYTQNTPVNGNCSQMSGYYGSHGSGSGSNITGTYTGTSTPTVVYSTNVQGQTTYTQSTNSTYTANTKSQTTNGTGNSTSGYSTDSYAPYNNISTGNNTYIIQYTVRGGVTLSCSNYNKYIYLGD